MTIGERIREKLAAALTPTRLDVVDESHMHAGHAGARVGGDSHFRVAVASVAFTGLSRVERQRKVNALLTEEFADGMHALSVTARTPEEDATP